MLGQNFFNERVFYKFFPGATSRGFFHYIKPTLQDCQTDFDISVPHMGIIHIGINDILNLGSTEESASNSILQMFDVYFVYS